MFKFVDHYIPTGCNTQIIWAQKPLSYFVSRCEGINCFCHSSSCGLAVLLRAPSRHHFFAALATLWAGAHTASHQGILPNTQRTTFINVTALLPAVHFFLWMPWVHFSCPSSAARYLVRPVILQQHIHRISFKVLQSLVSADLNKYMSHCCVLRSGLQS